MEKRSNDIKVHSPAKSKKERVLITSKLSKQMQELKDVEEDNLNKKSSNKKISLQNEENLSNANFDRNIPIEQKQDIFGRSRIEQWEIKSTHEMNYTQDFKNNGLQPEQPIVSP